MPQATTQDNLIRLPGGDWVEQFGQPCQCGATVFLVERARLSIRPNGAKPFVREVVRSRCPTCVLESDRYSKNRRQIGTHDLLAGTIDLNSSS